VARSVSHDSMGIEPLPLSSTAGRTHNAGMPITRVPFDGFQLALTHEPASAPIDGRRRAVLYIHGATFPCSLAIFWRFGSHSWSDRLTSAGFDVFGLDFLGYGDSDRYPEMNAPADGPRCRGRAGEAADQIAAAVDHIRKRLDVDRVHLVAHSWGTMAAGLHAIRRPLTVDRLVLFAPITARGELAARPVRPPAWQLVSAQDQWNRFSGYVPEGEPLLFPRESFEPWAAAYLGSDRGAGTREPRAVKVPGGPVADIVDAQAGVLPYEPARVECPTLIVRGDWDPWPTDRDAQWLFDELRRAPVKRDVKLSRGTHIMHLETGRAALFHEIGAFLAEHS
jgi:pimeloyl-ACP methyl ester carboxylesterase